MPHHKLVRLQVVRDLESEMFNRVAVRQEFVSQIGSMCATHSKSNPAWKEKPGTEFRLNSVNFVYT